MLLGRHGWLRLFTADRAVDATAEPVLQVASAYVVFDGLTIVVNGALKGCGRQMIQERTGGFAAGMATMVKRSGKWWEGANRGVVGSEESKVRL